MKISCTKLYFWVFGHNEEKTNTPLIEWLTNCSKRRVLPLFCLRACNCSHMESQGDYLISINKKSIYHTSQRAIENKKFFFVFLCGWVCNWNTGLRRRDYLTSPYLVKYFLGFLISKIYNSKNYYSDSK